MRYKWADEPVRIPVSPTPLYPFSRSKRGSKQKHGFSGSNPPPSKVW